MELKSRLAIDKNNIDQEVIEQPELYYHAAEQAAMATSEYDAKKEESKRVFAEVYSEYRTESESIGKKATEASLNAQVEIDTRVVQIKEELTKALLNKETSAALKEAFIQRGYMLKELCSMYVSGFLTNTAVTNQPTYKEAKINERRKLISDSKRGSDR